MIGIAPKQIVPEAHRPITMTPILQLPGPRLINGGYLP